MNVLRGAAMAAAAVLLLSGCSGDDGSDTSSEPATQTVEKGATTPGTELRPGEPAVVRLTANRRHDSRISLTVTKVTRGRVKDLRQFDLDKAAKNSGIFYVDTRIKNTGDGDLSRQQLTLYGKVSDDLVVPPVVFGSTFKRCSYQPLPDKFTHGKATKLCMVMLVPKHGKISEVQWRPADDSEPISWVLP